MKLEVKKYKIFSEITGSLLPFYKNDEYKDFNLKRFFFIYGRKNFVRFGKIQTLKQKITY